MVYILRTLLHEGLGLRHEITANKEQFAASALPKINYSEEVFDGIVSIKPHTILFDHGIRDYQLQVNTNLRYKKIFFKNTGNTIPFDLFGAAFWLLTRYEEYLPYKPDKENRFHYRSCLAYQYEFLEVPLVNLWLFELKAILQTQYSELRFDIRSYEAISTIDIDNVYKYKHKGFVRTLAGFISDKSWVKSKQRLRIILNQEQDPFDCYDFLIESHKLSQSKAIYFLLLGDYGPNDKNHSATDLRFQSLIKHLGDYSMMGIHPSYGSNNNLRQLKVEVARLGNIIHRLITKSRQHFSMLKFPQTYQNLLQAGLMSDYSMGYTNHNGFRASYCYPYKWYSLDIESVSSLTIHPFCISENCLLSNSAREHKTFMELASPLVNEVKTYGGELISIFHNDSFTTKMKKFYREFLEVSKA